MKLSLRADPWNEWIYDPSHRNYDSPQAKWLREARLRAIGSAPKWMIEDARSNDEHRDYERMIKARNSR